MLGVEAEYFLGLVRALTTPPTPGATPRERGDQFLLAAGVSARRLMALAQPLELATQAYLSELRRSAAIGKSTPADDGDVWWPAEKAEFALGEPLELTLRRCGFSYRQCVAAHLAPNVEAIGEYLHLVLHALNTLPPPGIVPHATLANGLEELAATLQGHVIPHHIADLSRDVLGLLSGIALLYQLDALEDASVGADLEWARAQLVAARAEAQRLKEQPAPAAARRGGLLGIVRRAFGGSAAANHTTPAAWLAAAEREWQDTVAALQAIEKANSQHVSYARS
jgi:hypothetical protein